MIVEPSPPSAIADAIYSALGRAVDAFDVARALVSELAASAWILVRLFLFPNCD